MNIFKVFASSKKNFPEEFMSAFLLWLLNPQMEHGLGNEFLQRFIKALAKKDAKLQVLERHLINQLRRTSEDDKFKSEAVLCDLETHVKSDTDEAFIDIVLEFSDTVVAIENKIYSNSVADATQLCREYNGLRNAFSNKEGKKRKRIVLLFLVPSDIENIESMPEWQQGPIMEDDDFREIVTWKENDKGYTSIFTLISELLADEGVGKTEPIPEYTRHTLKGLNSFISNDFQGYYYEKAYSKGNGLNPRESLQTLLSKTDGYVGVQHGINGFLRMPKKELEKASFQYTIDSERSGNRNWLPVNQSIPKYCVLVTRKQRCKTRFFSKN